MAPRGTKLSRFKCHRLEEVLMGIHELRQGASPEVVGQRDAEYSRASILCDS